MSASARSTRRGPLLRRAGFVVAAGLLGLLTGLAGVMFVIFSRSPDDTVHRIHNAGIGLLLLLLAAGLLGTALTRGRGVAGLQQVALGLASWSAAGLLTGVTEGVVLVLIVLTLLVVALHPRRSAILAAGRPSAVLGGLALAGAAALTWYATGQIAMQRAAPPTEAHAYPDPHYAWMAALALTLALLALLAALRTDGWRIPAWSAGIGAALFGLDSLATPLLSGSAGRAGGALAAIGGIAFIVVAEMQARRDPVRRADTPDAPAGPLEQVV